MTLLCIAVLETPVCNRIAPMAECPARTHGGREPPLSAIRPSSPTQCLAQLQPLGTIAAKKSVAIMWHQPLTFPVVRMPLGGGQVRIREQRHDVALEIIPAFHRLVGSRNSSNALFVETTNRCMVSFSCSTMVNIR